MFTGKGRQLTIYLGETDQHHHKALYMAIVELLRREGIAGATVTRGVAGFGASSRIHTSAILRLSMDLPIVITLIDRAERIEQILPALVEMAPSALMTLQDVEIARPGIGFRHGLPDVTVERVMRREVVTVRADDSLTRVVELLLDKDFTAVPVVDTGGRVVGMVSDTDLLTRGGMQIGLSLKRAADAEFVRELHRSLENPERRVNEIMTREVVTVRPDTSLADAAHLMVTRRLKRLPVVDASGKLVGILGRLDVLNTIAAVHIPEWQPGTTVVGEHATVADVMSRDVPTVRESTAVAELFEMLVSSTHRRVVVIDSERRVVGIIADSDLVSRVAPESRAGLIRMLVARVPLGETSEEARQHLARLHGQTAADLMTRKVVTVRAEMPVASALALSAEKRTKRMPVVDADGKLVGIVGRTEMMRALLAGAARGGM